MNYREVRHPFFLYPLTRLWCKMTAWLSSSFWCMVSVPLFRNPSTYSLISKIAEIVFFILTLFVGTRISSIFRVGTEGWKLWKALGFSFLVGGASETLASKLRTQIRQPSRHSQGSVSKVQKHYTTSRYVKK